MSSRSIFVLVTFVVYKVVGWGTVDPTKGFISQHLNQSNLVIQRPYDVPEDERYSFKNGVHKLWVFKTDKPHTPTSKTNPRTEIRVRGNDYSSGVWQFEAFGYVPYGTSGVCIMQVFGSSPPQATTLMLRVYNGTLSYYRAPVVVPNIYGRWFKLNVVHDVEGRRVEVYIDGVLKYEAAGRGRGEAEGTSHYFKCGVYAQNDASYYMESRWKKIRVVTDMAMGLDHNPLIIHLNASPEQWFNRWRKVFGFETMWTRAAECEELIRTLWGGGMEGLVLGIRL
ncbi:UNVERIFIED_CONTAM: Citrate-binding protein [Sesamum radiatum]|uniref:Citrate-binding protein n=1 Tax=Sesamum radiatum TaxID=300843 RepID=A0AAW2P2Y7_SESRA